MTIITYLTIQGIDIAKIPVFRDNPAPFSANGETHRPEAIECRLKAPCRACGGNRGNITVVDQSTGNPHHYRLECGDCGRFQKWVSQREVARKLGKREGGRDA